MSAWTGYPIWRSGSCLAAEAGPVQVGGGLRRLGAQAVEPGSGRTGRGTFGPVTAHELAGLELVRVSATSGQVVVTAENRTDVEIDAGDAVRDGSTLTVRVGSDSVEVRVPEGSAVVVGSQSGQVELKGRFGS